MFANLFKKKPATKVTEETVERPFKQLLKRYPKMPVSNGQLYEVYFAYLDQENLQDRDSILLQKINEANQKSIYSEFKCFMHKVFQGFDEIFFKIEYTSGLSQLDELVSRNAPQFIQQEVSQSQIAKFSQNSIFKSGFTPVGEIQDEKINDKNREDIIFGYLFEKIHLILNKYKLYYQMENVDDLEMEIYLSFSAYIEENFGTMQQREKIQPTEEEKSKEKIEQKEERGKSDLVDQLIDVVLENAQNAKLIKKSEENEQKNNALIIKNYEVSPLRIFGGATEFFGKVYKDGLTKTLTTVFHYARQKSIKNAVSQKMNEQAEDLSFKLYETILKNHKRHNLTKDYGLPTEQFKIVEEFIEGVHKNDPEILHQMYTEDDKQSLLKILKEIIESPEINIRYQHVVQRIQTFIKYFVNAKAKQSKELKDSGKHCSKKGLKTTLYSINTISQLPNTFYFIVFLYRNLQANYTPGSRRILIRICHEVQEKFKKMESSDKEFRRFSLVHALKILQGQYTKRSLLCKIITNQKPFRESQLPLVHERREYFEQFKEEPFYKIEEAQDNLEVELARIHIQEHKKKFKEVPKLQILKLSHSKYRKTVTILISGFLSEDTNKFQEWMGILEPTYDSQIYALKWQSKNIESILAYTIDTCKDIALAGVGVGLIGGPYLKAVMVLREIITKYNQNPFTPCFDVATVTGVFLADLLISLFDGHFINLAGFSLGTQVIASTLHRLKSKGKLHMINRVITMGGVADKKQMRQILDSVEQNKENPVEISWTNVYCEKDNILRYLLRISMPSIDPIGLSSFASQALRDKEKSQIKMEEQKTPKCYEIDDINVTEFISGHLSYRANMKNIARLIGIKDQ